MASTSSYSTVENRDRLIPAWRVAEFIERYCDQNYPESDEHVMGREGRFAEEVGVSERGIWGIRNGDRTNVTFRLLDQILTRLDMVHLWHLKPEDGGFSDYYADRPAPAALASDERRRASAVTNAKKRAFRHGTHWLDELHRQALNEDAKRAA